MKRFLLLLVVFLVLLVGGGIAVARLFMSPPNVVPSSSTDDSGLYSGTIEKNTDVTVSVSKDSGKANTIVLRVGSLSKKYSGVEYEITYDSEGLIKGVNSGSKLIDVADQESFERDVYLGTCSRNVCKPDTGVTSVSVVLQFTDTNGKKSQFTQDFPL